MKREFCARCGVKHLGQAAILMKETAMGYPQHVYFCLAHMAEAADEIVELMPEEANAIRDQRLRIEEGLRTGLIPSVDFESLMMLVAKGAMLEETLK